MSFSAHFPEAHVSFQIVRDSRRLGSFLSSSQFTPISAFLPKKIVNRLLGLVLRVLVTAASVPERTGAKVVLKRVHDMGNQVKRLHTIWMDGGYRGEEFSRWVMNMLRWIVVIVLRPLEKQRFVILPKRWVVERTFSWLNWCRRLSKDYERLPGTSETFIYIAMIRIMVKRLV